MRSRSCRSRTTLPCAEASWSGPGVDFRRIYDVFVTDLATPTPLAAGDRRTTVPLFTLRECATYLHTPLSTLHGWAQPRNEVPLITTLASSGRQATIPFVGFAEAFVLGALRKAGVPMQRIRPAVKKLSDEIGLDHALASERVYTDGAELIFDYASSTDDERLLTVVRTGQEHFADVIRDYLKPIMYGNDGWAARVRLPAYARAEVTVDPTEAFGQPLLVHGGARVEDLVDRFRAGDGFAEIATDFDVPSDEVEDVIRVALRLPA
jgi:uncharacterized protein (DUF433 family)